MKKHHSLGFTLVELAISLVIISLLMVGAIYTLSAQLDQRSYEETRARLAHARELLLSYAVVNGRLPCPARSNSAGTEVRNGSGECRDGGGVEDHYGGPLAGGVTGGFLPGATIGFGQLDADGFAVDAWNNRIRYAVAKTITGTGCPGALPHFVRADRLKANGIICQPSDLVVCKSSGGITGTSCGAAGNQVVSQNLIVAIIYSTGKSGSTGALGADEQANLNGDAVFVFHTPAPNFDDQYIWVTAGELYNRMIAAAILP